MEDIIQATLIKVKNNDDDTTITMSSQLDEINSKIQFLLSEITQLMNEEHAVAIYAEITDFPTRYLTDSRKIYRDLAHLEQERLTLIRQTNSNFLTSYDDILMSLRQRLQDECKWLVERFKYMYFELKEKGEPFHYILQKLQSIVTESTFNSLYNRQSEILPIKNKDNIPFYPHFIGIGPYLFQQDKSASYCLNFNLTYKEESFLSEIIDFIAAENVEFSNVLPKKPVNISHSSYQYHQPTIQSLKSILIKLLFDNSECEDVIKFHGPMGSSLGKSFSLESEIDWLKKCRRALVIFNNNMFWFNELRTFGDKECKYQLGMNKPFTFPKHLLRFVNDI